MNPFFLAGCVLGGGLVLYLLSLGIAFGGVPENRKAQGIDDN